MLLQIIEQSNPTHPTTDISASVDVLSPTVDITIDSVMWFTPYLSSDFPTITCDKRYFFLYSTDHDAGVGGVYWGKGDYLDLRDFIELGKIIDGYQAETPFLMLFSSNAEKIHLYYHTDESEPGNGGIQQTRLMTTTGGLLDSATWTDRGRPLGSEVGDDHTGYLRIYNINSVLKCTHYRVGANAGTDTPGIWQYSTMDADGYGVTRGNDIDNSSVVSGDRNVVVANAYFFNKYNQWWCLAQTETNTGFSSTSPTKGFALYKSNEDLEFVEELNLLNNESLTSKGFYAYIEGDLAYLYITEIASSNPMKYATYDLTQLQNYI